MESRKEMTEEQVKQHKAALEKNHKETPEPVKEKKGKKKDEDK